MSKNRLLLNHLNWWIMKLDVNKWCLTLLKCWNSWSNGKATDSNDQMCHWAMVPSCSIKVTPLQVFFYCKLSSKHHGKRAHNIANRVLRILTQHRSKVQRTTCSNDLPLQSEHFFQRSLDLASERPGIAIMHFDISNYVVVQIMRIQILAIPLDLVWERHCLYMIRICSTCAYLWFFRNQL